MVGAPCVIGLAGAELASELRRDLLALATDEDRLALDRAGRLDPGELAAPAGEVEQSLPVAAGEMHDALRAQDVARQTTQEAIERVLVERPCRRQQEAVDPVLV